MRKTILIFIYSLFFVWFVYPLIYIDSLYLWIIHKPEIIKEIKPSSLYTIVWDSKLAKELIEFKIKHTIFHYEKENEKNYDLFLITNNFSFDEMFDLIRNRQESNYYHFIKLLKENDNNYFNENDIEIINSLKVLLNKEIYRKELREDYNNLIPKLLKRVKEINEKEEYNKIYKKYLIINLENLYEYNKNIMVDF